MAKVAYVSAQSRSEPFGFICSRCSHCCHGQQIQLNPYEIARLAANRGVDSAELRSRWTQGGEGIYLAQKTEGGACVFLGPEGCSVHPDRPLACRLYPLGRRVTEGGSETFTHVSPHPMSRGTFHKQGTIADFLAAQEVDAFIAAADDYFSWLCRVRKVLAITPASDLSDTTCANELLDMDSAVASYCLRRGEPIPSSIEDRRQLHLAILEQALIEIEGAPHDTKELRPE